MNSYFLPRDNYHSSPKSNNMFSSKPALGCEYRDGYEYKFMHIMDKMLDLFGVPENSGTLTWEGCFCNYCKIMSRALKKYYKASFTTTKCSYISKLLS